MSEAHGARHDAAPTACSRLTAEYAEGRRARREKRLVIIPRRLSVRDDDERRGTL